MHDVDRIFYLQYLWQIKGNRRSLVAGVGGHNLAKRCGGTETEVPVVAVVGADGEASGGGSSVRRGMRAEGNRALDERDVFAPPAGRESGGKTRGQRGGVM